MSVRFEQETVPVRAALILLILVHFALGCWFAAATPYRTPGVILSQRGPDRMPIQVPDVGAPDERQHANYIAHLLDGKGFPVLVWQVSNPENPGEMMRNPELAETYQAHQPPLFYLIAAGWSKLVGADPESSSDGFKLRLLNILIGSATVLGVFYLGYWGFSSGAVGLIAGAFAALLPMHLALNGALSNDPLLFALCTWVLAISALAMKTGWTWKLALPVGILTGLALLTKTTAVALLPILLLAVLLRMPPWEMVLGVVVLTISIAAPWWLRNQQLYGDPLAISAFNEAFITSPKPSDFGMPVFEYWVNMVGWWTIRSFFGAFGYMDIWLNERGMPMSATPNALYRLLLVGLVIAVIGWLASRLKGVWRESGRTQVLLELFFVVIVLLFIRFNLQYFQAQARYILPAIGPISIFVALGALQLAKQRWVPAASVVVIALLGVNLYALTRLPEEFAKRTGLG